MKYRVEPIGSEFNDKAIADLAGLFSARSAEGWELHTVFSVKKTGCMGSSEGMTYLAVFKRP